MLLELGRVLLYNTKFYTMPSEAASRTRHFKPLSETTEMYYILMKAQLCTILARLSAPHTYPNSRSPNIFVTAKDAS